MLIADRSVAGASEAFWNRVEAFEKRIDAQLAKDLTVALPLELTAEQNIALVRDFVEKHILSRGMVADWVYHDNPGNPHIHLMTTLRPLTEYGFGAKKVAVIGEEGEPLRTKAGKIVYELWAGGTDDFNAFRDAWFERMNHHLALNGINLRVDGRSYEKQGIDLVPTIHLGVGAKAIERKAEGEDAKPSSNALSSTRSGARKMPAASGSNPELVLDLITREKSVFDERDVAKILHRYIDDAGLFRNMMARIMQSGQVLRLERERISLATGKREPSKFTTHELIRLEATMARSAMWLDRRLAWYRQGRSRRDLRAPRPADAGTADSACAYRRRQSHSRRRWPCRSGQDHNDESGPRDMGSRRISRRGRSACWQGGGGSGERGRHHRAHAVVVGTTLAAGA